MNYLILASCVVAISWLSVTSSQTQSKVLEWQTERLVVRRADGAQEFRILDRVEIESFSVGEPITIGQPFTAGDDWLKDLVIRVRNVSGQHLTSIQMTLVLPQMLPGSPDVVYCYGCALAEKAKGIAVGESVDLKMIGGPFYDFVKTRAAEKGGISQIHKAQIREMFVTLPDSTHWISGCVKTSDAKNSCPPPRP